MGQRLPEPGRWYDDPAEFAALTPGAKPRRPVDTESVGSEPSVPARKRVRSRPSAEPLAPWGGRFYWCAYCNYVNTPDQKGAARCPRHRQEWERTRKAAQRAAEGTDKSNEGAEPGQHGSLIDEMAALARRANATAKAIESDLRSEGLEQSAATKDMTLLLGLTRKMLQVVDEMQSHQTGR